MIYNIILQLIVCVNLLQQVRWFITGWVDSSIISADSNLTQNIIRETIVSSILKWGYQDNFKAVFFTERFRAHKKHQNAKQATFHPLRRLCVQKLLHLLFSVSLFLFCWLIFACDVFFGARNLSVKKKINKLEIFLIAFISDSLY